MTLIALKDPTTELAFTYALTTLSTPEELYNVLETLLEPSDALDQACKPWDDKAQGFVCEPWERCYNAISEVLVPAVREIFDYDACSVPKFQILRHACEIFTRHFPGNPLGVGHRQFWVSPWDFSYIDQPMLAAAHFCSFDLEDDERSVTNTPENRDEAERFLMMLHEQNVPADTVREIEAVIPWYDDLEDEAA